MKLEDIRKLCDEATPGPWKVGHPFYEEDDLVTVLDRGDYSLFGDCCVGVETDPEVQATAQFIAAARTMVPKLLAVAEAAKTLVTHPLFDPALNDPKYGQEPSGVWALMDTLRQTLKALEGE